MDGGFSRPVRRHSRELNVVPILDMMTTLIIFLLQITSFLEYTKITVPPSSTSVISDPLRPPPLAPKLFLMQRSDGKGYRVQLTWSGDSAGEIHRSFPPAFSEGESGKPVENMDRTGLLILKSTTVVMNEFREKFHEEKNIQLGMNSKVPYQYLISAMDGVQAAFGNLDPAKGNVKVAELANLVLLSYADVDAEVARAGAEL